MTFSVALYVVSSGGSLNGTTFVVEAFNNDEARGIGHRVMDYCFPKGEFPFRTVVATTWTIDPSKPLEDQIDLIDGSVYAKRVK